MSESESGEDCPDSCKLPVSEVTATVKPSKARTNREKTEKTEKYHSQHYKTEGPVKAIFIRNTKYQPDTTLDTRWAIHTDCEVVMTFLDLIKAEPPLEKENLTAEDLRSLLKELKGWHWTNPRPRLVVVVVVAYGDGGQAMLTHDGQWVEVKEILQALQCPELAGVPKMLLLNMEPLPETAPARLRRVVSTGSDMGSDTGSDTGEQFQGHQDDEATPDCSKLLPGQTVPGRPKSAAQSRARRLRVPKEADVLQIVSEVTCGAGMAGKQQQGNAFLSALAENLIMDGGKLDVCQLLTRVNQQLCGALQQSAAIATRTTMVAPPRRASFFVSTLTKELYLIPNKKA